MNIQVTLYQVPVSVYELVVYPSHFVEQVIITLLAIKGTRKPCNNQNRITTPACRYDYRDAISRYGQRNPPIMNESVHGNISPQLTGQCERTVMHQGMKDSGQRCGWNNSKVIPLNSLDMSVLTTKQEEMFIVAQKVTRRMTDSTYIIIGQLDGFGSAGSI